MKVADPLSDLNRVPSSAERTHLLALIQQDQEDASVLFRQIEFRKGGKERSERDVDVINNSLLLSTTLQATVKERIEENLRRIEKLEATEMNLKGNTSPTKTEDRSTETNFRTILGYYRGEIGKYRVMVQSDMEEVEQEASRTYSLEQQLLEARSRLDQESKTIGLLEGCHQRILSAISGKEALLSHGRLLPDEILVAIFQYLLADILASVRKNSKSSRKFAVLKLTWICRRWRNIIYHNPSLRKYIPIPTPRPSTSYSPKLAAMSDYLPKCENMRTLIIHWPRNGPWQVGAAERYDPRTRTYVTAEPTSCADPLEYCMNHAPNDVKATFGSAETLELIGRDQNTKVACDIAANCYIIRNLRPVFNSTEISTRITEVRLHVQDATLARLYSILKHLANLSLLELEIPGGCSGDSTSIVRPAVLSKLKRFLASAKVITQVLWAVIITPALCQLSVEGEGGGPLSLDDWRSCARRAALSENITHLTLSDLSSEGQARTDLLPKFLNWTRVEHLVLRGAHHAPIVDTMATDPVQFPKLMKISLIDTDIPGEILWKFVTSRNNQDHSNGDSTTRVQKLTMDGCKGTNQTLCENLTAIVEEIVVYG
jgi:hypothetical protein